jgi:hypothetical protein
MALIAAEKAAEQKALESPQAQEALSPALEATAGIVAAAPLLLDDDALPDLSSIARALQAAASAKGPNLAALAEEAAAIARHVEIAVYERLEAEDAATERDTEAFVLATIEDDRRAFKYAVEKFLRQMKRRR